MRSRFTPYLLAAGVSLALSGCASFQGFPDPPRTSTAADPEAGYQLGDAGIRKYNAEQDLVKRALIRNDVIDARMAEIDRAFAEFERSIYKEGVGSGVGTDWALLALTSASTLSTVTHVKTIYSTLSTALAGGNAAFDKRVLFDKTLPALIAQMVAQRETIRLAVRIKEQSPVEGYSLFAAQSDLETYAFAGSIAGAIASVAEDAGRKSSVAKEDLKDLRTGSFGQSVSARKLRTFWRPNGATDDKAEARLRTWLAENGYDSGAGAITMFINDKKEEPAKVQAVKDLGL